MVKHPKISIYMPTHNRKELLPRAINSVINQSYKNIELIIVDDGSEDDSWSLLEQYSSQHPFIIPLRHKTPRGACSARNTAIAVASGEFITGLDDDDEIEPSHLANLISNWDEHYSCVAASMLNDNGTSRLRQGKEHGLITLEALLHYNRLGNQVLTKTSRLRDIKGFDERLPAFQDYDCWVRLIDNYGAAWKLKDATYVLHTEHELGRISSNKERRLRALDIFLDKHSKSFSKSHFKSAKLMRKRIEGKTITFVDALKLFCVGNYRAVISAYLISRKAVK